MMMNKQLEVNEKIFTVNHESRTSSGKVRQVLHPMLQLQQLIGNQAVLRMLRSGATQPKSIAGPPLIQRKIAADLRVSLDDYLASKGVTGYKRNGNAYSHGGMCDPELKKQILCDMLASKRGFSVKGDNNQEAEQSLEAHLSARKGIIDFAAQRKYGFAAGSDIEMNPIFWERDNRTANWKTKSSNPMDAYNDLNVTPKSYKVPCVTATAAALYAGSGSFDFKTDKGADHNDWIPGDKGYIENTNFIKGKSVDGEEGENLIYVGYGRFWGHTSDPNSYKSLDEWFSLVKSWNGGAQFSDTRVRPKEGLLD